MRRPSLIAVALTAVLLAACTPISEAGSPPEASGIGPGASAPPSAPTPQVSVPVAPATPAPVEQAPVPERLTIASLGVDMPVSAVGVQEDGSMEIPERPQIAGWYEYGPAPGDPEGTTVLAAHVDDREYGVGPLAKLRDATAGDVVSVTDADGTTTQYVTESVTSIPRAQLPVDDLFTRTGPRSLALITCGGRFDEQTRTYSDNVVLIAQARS